MESGSGLPTSIPEWLQLTVTGIVGTVIFLATRFGWNQAKEAPAESKVELAGAIVDARSIKHLTDSMDFHMDRLTNLHDEKIRHEKATIESNNELRSEIRELRQMLRDKCRGIPNGS